MLAPVFIARKGYVVLWSWGNYRYTIDVGNQETMLMENVDFEDALKMLEEVASKQIH
jgi:hypothetical protein